MNANDVSYVLEALERAGIDVWLEGGWGVDALLGRQTRPHADLDVLVAAGDAARAREILEAEGFRLTVDWLPTRFVMEDRRGRAVDIHPVTFDAAGDATLMLTDGTAAVVPAAGLAGTGTISGRPVRCFTAAQQMVAHDGYPPLPQDVADVAALAAACGVEPPELY